MSSTGFNKTQNWNMPLTDRESGQIMDESTRDNIYLSHQNQDPKSVLTSARNSKSGVKNNEKLTHK